MLLAANSTLKPLTIKRTYITEDRPHHILLVTNGVSGLSAAEGLCITQVQGYVKACAHLTHLFTYAPSKMPYLIVLDLPYNKADLSIFINWMRSAKPFSHIPVIYNELALSPYLASTPLQLNLVDDVTDVYSNADVLQYKAQHLGQMLRRKRKGNSILFKRMAFKGLRGVGNGARRLFDIAVSLTLLLALSPLFLLLALLIKLESKGSVFYVSPRAGRGYKVFQFYKFRTMVPGADGQREVLEKLNQYNEDLGGARFFKIKSDPRITRLGSLLRNTSLDELPQLINVLKGDMSIVGNRPLPLYEAATLTTDEWAERFMAPAGITGLWQIKKRGRGDMSVQERIHLDISYARRSNLMYDLWILANTPGALIQKTDV